MDKRYSDRTDTSTGVDPVCDREDRVGGGGEHQGSDSVGDRPDGTRPPTGTVTAENLAAGLAVAGAIGEVIQTLGAIPSGHLYAMVMSTMSLGTYEKCIDLLVRTRLVERGPSHMLVWIGGADASQTPR